MFKEISVATHGKNEFIDITEKIKRFIKEENVKEGKLLLFVPHTTAAVTINENADPDVKKDMIQALKRMVPEHEYYAHGEGNSPAHVKASLVGMSETIIIHQGEPVLGTWQGVYFCEFDGPRTRKLVLRMESD